MAYIDVDEPVEYQPSPTGQVDQSPVKHKGSTTQSSQLKKRLGYTLAAGAVLFAVVQLVSLNNQAKQLEQQVAGQSTEQAVANVDLEAKELASKISAYLDLPDETPTVATVTDVSKVKGQAFFARAENNDKVLLFEQSGRAVLYRPSTNKVIEFATTN